MIKIKKSDRNTNKHTQQGMELLEKSIASVGAIESISVSKEGTIISGHARKDTFDKLGMVPVEVKLGENEYPVIVRDDIQDNTKRYFEAQILANTTAKKNIDLDLDLIEDLIEEYDIEVEDVGIDEVRGSDNIDGTDFGTDFELPEGDKAPFQQMTFTLADEQATQVKNALADIKQTEEYKYAETMGNENSNGNALYLIIMQWAQNK